MRFAVVSTDGVEVNEHFGKAGRFLIFEAAGEGCRLVEEQAVLPLSVGDPDHPFDPDRFGKIAEALAGCQRVYCTKIGERPAAELSRRGIEPVVYEGPIASIPG